MIIDNEFDRFRSRYEDYFKVLNCRFFFFLLLSVGLPIANAPDVLQPCGLL